MPLGLTPDPSFLNSEVLQRIEDARWAHLDKVPPPPETQGRLPNVVPSFTIEDFCRALDGCKTVAPPKPPIGYAQWRDEQMEKQEEAQARAQCRARAQSQAHAQALRQALETAQEPPGAWAQEPPRREEGGFDAEDAQPELGARRASEPQVPSEACKTKGELPLPPQ